MRVDFRLFREVASKILCMAALKNKGAQENWLVFEDKFLRAQENSAWSMKQKKASLTKQRSPPCTQTQK